MDETITTSNNKYCPNCTMVVDGYYNFCNNCGAPLFAQTQNTTAYTHTASHDAPNKHSEIGIASVIFACAAIISMISYLLYPILFVPFFSLAATFTGGILSLIGLIQSKRKTLFPMIGCLLNIILSIMISLLVILILLVLAFQ